TSNQGGYLWHPDVLAGHPGDNGAAADRRPLRVASPRRAPPPPPRALHLPAPPHGRPPPHRWRQLHRQETPDRGTSAGDQASAMKVSTRPRSFLACPVTVKYFRKLPEDEPFD